MVVSKDSWHTRIYRWWYKNKYQCTGDPSYSNLCPYMRAVMFWAPLRFLFWSWVKVGKVPLNALTIPVTVYAVPTFLGYFSYGIKASLWIAYDVVGIVMVGAAVFFSIMYFLIDRDGYAIYVHPQIRKIINPSFVSMIKGYLRSAHDGVCPPVDFK